MKKDLNELQKNIGFKFSDLDILKTALTHRSYLNEHRDFSLPHNERLEFLGDAVLELVVTDYLYRKYPNEPEGELTNYRSALVNYKNLSITAEAVKLNDYLMLSRGEAKDVGRAREVILANAMEALIGAVYLDGGYKAAEVFVDQYILAKLDEIIATGAHIDAKSQLQEIVQERNGVTPVYKVIGESGPDHDKIFEIGVFIENKELGVGRGHSKQEAEISAAEEALKNLSIVS